MTDSEETIKQLIDGLRISECDKAAAWRRCKELEADNERLRSALLKITNSVHGSFDDAHVMASIASAALEAKDAQEA